MIKTLHAFRPLHAFRLFLAGLLASLALSAHAQLSIEITGTGASRFPVIIPIFENEGRLPQSVTDVVRADLERSGLFTLIDTGPLPMPESVAPDLAAVRSRGADAVLTGSLIPLADGRYEARFRLFDAQKQQELGAMSLPMSPAQNRMDAGQQLTWIEGLGQVVICAHFQADNAVNLVSLGGQHDDRRMVVLSAQTAADAEAIFTRHHQIKDDQMIMFAAAHLVHLGTIGSGFDFKALFAEIADQQVAQAGVVIDD